MASPMAGIALFVFIVTTIIWPSSSSIFRPSSHWLGKQKTGSNDDTSKITRVLRIRGGAEETKKDGTDKIKGCCIGIDLGTTYRYGHSWGKRL